LLAALSEGSTRVDNLLESDDIRYMLEALDTLKVPVERHSNECVTVTGQNGPINSPNPEETIDLFLGNAGTAMRPLAAALCMGQGKFVLDGVPRMRERPIADLMDGLQQLGADVTCVEETGCPPVTINAKGLKGGKASISGKMSSQFLSSLLMASPVVDGEVTIEIKDELISAPYVALTIGLMNKFGVDVLVEGKMNERPTFHIASNEKYKSPGSILVEGDASLASYFIAGAAITGGTVTVRGCGSESVQGDVAFADVMEKMGATVTWAPESITVTRDPSVKLKGVDVDCGKIPDAAMTLAVAALFAEGSTTIRNVYSWRLKETERMKAIVAECTKLGATVEEFEDYCIIHPPKDNKINDNVLIETYDDHRMAMTFSLAACGGVNVIINDPGCTAKTFPTYFDMLESIATH
jgi:3-phosphoshikimate 1-carboxyvinyltransferase